MQDTLCVSLFEAVNKPQANARIVTWPELVTALTTHTEASEKTSVGLFNFCRFSTPYRSNKHVIDVSALLLDVDKQPLEAVQRLAEKLAPYAHVGYSTHSHGILPGKFSLRLVVRLSRPVLGEEWRSFAAGITSWLGQDLDGCVVAASQSYYLPSCAPGRDKMAFQHPGALLDVQDVLASAPTVAPDDYEVPDMWRPGRVVGVEQLRELEGNTAVRLLGGEKLVPAGERKNHVARRDLVFQFLCKHGPCEPDAELLQLLVNSAQASRETWVGEFTRGSARAKAEAVHAREKAAQEQGEAWATALEAGKKAKEAEAQAFISKALTEAKAEANQAFNADVVKSIAKKCKNEAVKSFLLAAVGGDVPDGLEGAAKESGVLLGRKEAGRDLGTLKKPFEKLGHDHLKAQLELYAGIELGQAQARHKEDWRKACSMNEDKIVACEKNARVLLLMHEKVKGQLVYNVRSDLLCVGAVPWPRGKRSEWTSTDSGGAMQWISDIVGTPVSSSQVDAALQGVKEALPTFDPAEACLLSLPAWDDAPRLDTWLHVYAGAEDNAYTREVSRCSLIAAVARTLNPGCKVDQVVVLEGAQGAKKTSLLSALCPVDGLFLTAEGALSLDNVRLVHKLQGSWIVELGELSGLKKSAQEAAKAFLSEQIDNYRAPYGRHQLVRPRRYVFFGTTNHADYLSDPTGNRRFLPVPVSVCRPEAMRQDRAQIWAEALAAYRNGAQWWVDASPEVRAIQDSRVETDAIESQVLECAEHYGEVTYEQLYGYLGVPTDRQQAGRLSRILLHHGWKQGNRKTAEIEIPVQNVFAGMKKKVFARFWSKK